MARMYEQKKNGREWVDTGNNVTDDAGIIYKKLARELISKKLDGATWIKRIEQDYYYSGDHSRVTVTYNNNYRTVYIIEK